MDMIAKYVQESEDNKSCTIGAKSPYAFRANNALPFKYAYEPITVENH